MIDERWLPEDLRVRAAETARLHRDTLVADLDVLIGAALSDPPASDLRARLVTRVVDLLTVTLAAGNLADNPLLSELAGLDEGALKLADVFAAVQLADRAMVEELSLDAQLGATSEYWPAVTEILRRAPFDLLAAVCARRVSMAPQGLTDSVTTLMSRAVFEIALTKEIQRAVRYHHPLALILFEVDNLAGINETYGLGVGDLVLERLGVFMRLFFRQPDWVARYGVDSIAVLLPETVTRDAQALAEGARQAVAERLIFHDKEERPVGVTVSAAVVTVTLRGDSAEDHEPIDMLRVMTEAEAGVRRARARGGNATEHVEVTRDSLSVTEAAAHLHCSPATIRKLIAAGTLPAVETGGRTRLDRMAVEAYGQRISRQAHKPSSE